MGTICRGNRIRSDGLLFRRTMGRRSRPRWRTQSRYRSASFPAQGSRGSSRSQGKIYSVPLEYVREVSPFFFVFRSRRG